ncbi:MAG: hypothetical protein K2K75_10585 [Muribaculaceae bacterium]|nr:hypothetical protein [Muribaculaceae bacterium]
MFDFLTCGFWSVLGGLLTSLVIAGVLLMYSTQYTKRGSIEPLPLVLCLLLFCLLFYQMTLMYGAIGSKSIALEFISACHLQFGDEIDGEELKSQMTTLIKENPLVSFFIDYGDLEDFDWSQPIKSLRKVVSREYNWYIFRRVVWTAVFTGIAFVGIMMSMGRSHRSRKRRRSYSFDDDLDLD